MAEVLDGLVVDFVRPEHECERRLHAVFAVRLERVGPRAFSDECPPDLDAAWIVPSRP